MQMLPTVSVIMAAYNASDTIAAAINSITSQTFSAFELIVCDDASTDSTWQVLCELSACEPRMVLLRNECNLGAAAARNRCIRQARGQYIAVMDADDLCSENRLEVQESYLRNNHDISFVGLEGRFFYKEIGDRSKKYPFISFPQPKDFLMTLPFVHASLMFRAKILQEIAYPEGKRAMRNEDYALLLALYIKGYCGKNLSEAFYCIREDEETFRRRRYCYRITEFFVKWDGFRRLGLMPAGVLFAIKPLLVGLMPPLFLETVKGMYYHAKSER